MMVETTGETKIGRVVKALDFIQNLKLFPTADSSISMKASPEESLNSKHQITQKQNITIADLPEICTDKILSSFHINELIEVSKTNLSLRHSAMRVFRLKYGKKKFAIKYGKETDMARMIIHFGSQISKITLRSYGFDFRSIDNFKRKLLKIILEECSPTLEELTISDTYGLPLCTPFLNLQTINYDIRLEYNIQSTWFQIKQWFPKLQKITVSDHDGLSIFDDNFIDHIPNLKELWLFLSEPSARCSFQMAQLINTNSHIESLRISIDCLHVYNVGSIERFQSAISWENLNMISNLDIRQQKMMPMMDLENIAKLKNLKSLAISADCYPNIDRFYFPLEELLIETGGQNATTINFIVNHQFLKRLSIKIDAGLSSIHSKRIAEHLKTLTEISFDIVNFEHSNAPDFPNGLIEFVRHCKVLKGITVTYTPSEEIPKDDDKIKQIRKMYADFEEKIDKMSTLDKWKLYYECKALDIKFYNHNPVRFLMALRASKHSYIFKFVKQF